jgi:hypothetical protein
MVSIPADIKRQREQKAKIQNTAADESSAEALKDPNYIRRLKMANYGRWFIKPTEFSAKVESLNRELNK